MAKLTLGDAFDRNCHITYGPDGFIRRYIPLREGKIDMVNTVRCMLNGTVFVRKIEIIDWLPVLKLLQQEKLIDNEGRIISSILGY